MNAKATLLALTCLAVSPAWAINKCTIDGRVVFQDAACPGKGETLSVRPASGAAPTTQASEAAGGGAKSDASAKPQTEAQRIEQQIAASQQERRKQELEVRLVPDAFAAIRRQRAACDRDMKALQAKKSRANNNLAGATWESAISGEMTALATTCDTRNRELREDAAALRAECQQLGGCKR
ncbi:hypothetical protein KIH07_02910 [Hydrogenophaga taeniospiralis]|uniref:hypothetical protein n=1 Tax=Hydrogenophaga taeniospiralis TaxID=65656 RepID=UPI001CFAEC08|nr:hypothetical protein [Hydrogenophaga taeniospiralis]MCB4362669.1 hypothetical protein [Hydrogenophaga taeniospiralis]